MSTAIELRAVTKLYRRYPHRRQFATLKSALISGSLAGDLRPDETFTAVGGVSFSVPTGSAFGIIGRNGSGKSTLLKLIAGITKPTSGEVRVAGRISALIELGAGFHPEISGRENVFINGVMLGLTKREITERFDEIVRFSELEAFIDAPVKTYSSGMYMRLGFAVAVHVDPDILIVDEVLAVGDEGFSLKCLDKFAEFKRQGKTILLVTHGLGTVQQFCDGAVWLDEGKIKGRGDPRRVVHMYLSDVAAAEEELLSADDKKRVEATTPNETTTQAGSDESPPEGEPPNDMFRASEGRWGSGDATITNVTLDGNDGPTHLFQSGDRMTVRMRVTASEPFERLRLWHQHLQCGGDLLLWDKHRHRGAQVRDDDWRRRGECRHRTVGPRGGHLQARRGRPHARGAPLRTTTASFTPSESSRMSRTSGSTALAMPGRSHPTFAFETRRASERPSAW